MLDTSAIMAVLFDEPESDVFSLIINSNFCIVSAATVVECNSVLLGRRGLKSGRVIGEYLAQNRISVVDFDTRQIAAANSGRAKFGRGSGHPAQLNLGDTFSYALAKTRNIPLLFKGNDFIHTDIIPAIPQAAA